MKGYRKIVVDGHEWEYRISEYGQIHARCFELGETIFCDKTRVKPGWSHNDIERGIWKRYLTITPKEIAEWIRTRNQKVTS